MSPHGIFITDCDREELLTLIEGSDSQRRDARHVDDLAREVDRADIVASNDIWPSVVTLRSRVLVRDLGLGTVEAYTIVEPDAADVARGRISVLAPVGTALIGSQAGDVVEWRTPGGTRRLLVEEVLYQPEAAGHEPRC